MNFRRKRKTAKKSFDPPCIFQIAFSVFHAQKSCASPLSVRPSRPVSPEPPVCYFPILRPAVGQNRFRFAPAISKKLLFASIFFLFVYTFYFLKNLFFFCHLFSCTTLPNYAIVIAVRKHLYPILSLWVFPLPNPYRPERCFLTALRFLPKKHGESHAFFLSVFLPAV